MSKIRSDVKISVLKRDGYRCQECGVKVEQPSDLQPHFHHKLPKSAGGKTTEDNLLTLCGPCHLTKVRHTFRLEQAPTEDYPQYIKWMVREISIDLLAFSERLVNSDFPSAAYLSDYLCKVKAAINSVIQLVDACGEVGIGNGTLTFSEVPETEAASEIEDICKGLKIAWVSHYTQRRLDQLIRMSLPKQAEPNKV